MIKKIKMLMQKSKIDIQETRLIKYGFSSLLYYTIMALAILVVGIYLGIILDIIVFCLSFLFLRSSTGGYHVKSKFSCFLFFIIATVMIPFILNRIFISLDFLLTINTIMMICLLLSMGDLPIENKNRLLSESEKEYYKKRSIVFYLMECIILFLLNLFDIRHIATVMAAGMLINSLSVGLAIIQKKFVLTNKRECKK